MKRAALLRHLQAHGCVLLCEGSRRTLIVNQAAGKATTVPRHREINECLARKICHDLDVPVA